VFFSFFFSSRKVFFFIRATSYYLTQCGKSDQKKDGRRGPMQGDIQKQARRKTKANMRVAHEI